MPHLVLYKQQAELSSGTRFNGNVNHIAWHNEDELLSFHNCKMYSFGHIKLMTDVFST